MVSFKFFPTFLETESVWDIGISWNFFPRKKGGGKVDFEKVHENFFHEKYFFFKKLLKIKKVKLKN